MIKKLLFVTLLCVTIVNMSAQEEKIRIGVKAGLNLSSIIGDFSDDFDGRTSFHVGAVVEIPITEKFSVQPEILYSGQGVSQDFESDFIEIESNLKLDYINVPIMAKYYVFPGLSVHAGPQLGILISANNEVSSSGGGDVDFDVKDSYSTIDLGVNFGAGYQLPLGFFVDVRYNLGITDIGDDNDFSGISNRNGVFQLSVGYKF